MSSKPIQLKMTLLGDSSDIPILRIHSKLRWSREYHIPLLVAIRAFANEAQAQLRFSIASEKEGLYVRIVPETGDEPTTVIPAPLTNPELTEILRQIGTISIDGFVMPKRIYSRRGEVTDLSFSDIRTFFPNSDDIIPLSKSASGTSAISIELFRTPEQE